MGVETSDKNRELVFSDMQEATTSPSARPSNPVEVMGVAFREGKGNF